MWEKFKKRFDWFREELVKHSIIRLLLLPIWVLSGIWDLVLSESVPSEYANHLRESYQVVAMTTGFDALAKLAAGGISHTHLRYH